MTTATCENDGDGYAHGGLSLCVSCATRLVEESERLRAQMDAAINLLNAEVSRLRYEYGVALQVLLDHGVTPGEFEQALTETPEP